MNIQAADMSHWHLLQTIHHCTQNPISAGDTLQPHPQTQRDHSAWHFHLHKSLQVKQSSSIDLHLEKGNDHYNRLHNSIIIYTVIWQSRLSIYNTHVEDRKLQDLCNLCHHLYLCCDCSPVDLTLLQGMPNHTLTLDHQILQNGHQAVLLHLEETHTYPHQIRHMAWMVMFNWCH